MRLTKGCFGHQFKSNILRGFEFLRCGQMRRKETFGHNAGWYNKLGEKIGWGDLNKEDVVQLTKTLQDGELFITLGEQDSFWNFVTKIGVIGSMCATKEEEKEPGPYYVAEKARFVITNKGVFTAKSDYDDGRVDYEIEGIKIKRITREEILRMMSE